MVDRKLKETLAGMESPVRHAPGPQEIDTQALLRAWSLNVETMRSLIDHLDAVKLDNAKTQRDNQRTRRWLIAAAVVVALAQVVGFVRLHQSSSQMGRVLTVAMQADRELNTVQRQLDAVAQSVLKTNEAEAEAEIVKLDDAPKVPEEDNGADAGKAQAHRGLITARIQAQAMAIRAQAVSADEPKRAEVRSKAKKLREKAKTMGLGEEAVEPLDGL